MFNRESRPTITELVVALADSEVESADSTTNSTAYPVKIGLWVRAFSLCGKSIYLTYTFDSQLPNHTDTDIVEIYILCERQCTIKFRLICPILP